MAIEYGVTFYPEFEEAVILYRGVVSVRIGQGETQQGVTYDEGYLYAEYVDGLVQKIGPVSSFAEAVQAGRAGPGTPYPTAESWIQHIIDTTQNALDAEGYANGTHGGIEITDDTDPAWHNNASWWNDRAHDNRTAAETAQAAAETAQTASEAAQALSEAWATGGSSGTPTAQNNALYYATLAGIRADSVKGATTVTTFQNSNSGTVIPSGTWTENPNPQAGTYMWVKNVLTWSDLSTSTFYIVAAQGLIDSVNGLRGTVVIDGRNAYKDSSAATPVTISDAIDSKINLTDLITDAQIDALFGA